MIFACRRMPFRSGEHIAHPARASAASLSGPHHRARAQTGNGYCSDFPTRAGSVCLGRTMGSADYISLAQNAKAEAISDGQDPQDNANEKTITNSRSQKSLVSSIW